MQTMAFLHQSGQAMSGTRVCDVTHYELRFLEFPSATHFFSGTFRCYYSCSIGVDRFSVGGLLVGAPHLRGDLRSVDVVLSTAVVVTK